MIWALAAVSAAIVASAAYGIYGIMAGNPGAAMEGMSSGNMSGHHMHGSAVTDNHMAVITDEKEEEKMQKDPVCKMMVEERLAAATYDYKGKKYYFCAKICKEKFEKDPEKYLKDTK